MLNWGVLENLKKLLTFWTWLEAVCLLKWERAALSCGSFWGALCFLVLGRICWHWAAPSSTIIIYLYNYHYKDIQFRDQTRSPTNLNRGSNDKPSKSHLKLHSKIRMGIQIFGMSAEVLIFTIFNLNGKTQFKTSKDENRVFLISKLASYSAS